MQETSELIRLRPHLNSWSSIFVYVVDVVADFRLEVLHIGLQIRNQVLLLQHLQVLLLSVQSHLRLDSGVYAALEVRQLIQGCRNKIFLRRLVFLHTFKITDYFASLRLLLVDNLLEIVKLTIDLFGNLVLKPLLISDLLLHLSALVQVLFALFLNLL